MKLPGRQPKDDRLQMTRHSFANYVNILHCLWSRLGPVVDWGRSYWQVRFPHSQISKSNEYNVNLLTSWKKALWKLKNPFNLQINAKHFYRSTVSRFSYDLHYFFLIYTIYKLSNVYNRRCLTELVLDHSILIISSDSSDFHLL